MSWLKLCGKVVGERQEYLSQLYERRVVWKTRVIVDYNSHVLARLLHLVDNFAYRNNFSLHMRGDDHIPLS